MIADVTGAQPGKQRTSRAAARSTDWRRLNRPAGRPANTPLQKSRRLQIRANEKCQLSMRSGPDEAGKDEIRLRHTKYSGSDESGIEFGHTGCRDSNFKFTQCRTEVI